jgi:zinc transporter, ZIP family
MIESHSLFEPLLRFFEGLHPVTGALIATTFTWLVTASGAALVFLFRDLNRRVLDGMLGFTGGVMVAASFWSLLAPAIEMSPGEGFTRALPSAIGFATGAGFLFLLDKWLPHLHLNFPAEKAEGVQTKLNKTLLLVLAITLHNIPEGLAVGVLFGGVRRGFPRPPSAVRLRSPSASGCRISRRGWRCRFRSDAWACREKRVSGTDSFPQSWSPLRA